MNIGPIIPLRNQPLIKAKKAYLIDTCHRDHTGYHLTALNAIGLTQPELFPEECEQRLKDYCGKTPTRKGKNPKVLAYWCMPRMADGAILDETEMRYLERMILSVVAQGNIAIFNWHVPPSRPGLRQKGPDFNFIVSSITRLGTLRVPVRQCDSSLWGLLRETANYALTIINSRRRTLNYPLIPSVDEAKHRKRMANGSLSLAEQISLLPSPLDSDEQIRSTLESLGYEVSDGHGDEVRISRRFCPAVPFETASPKARRQKRAFFVSLASLRAEAQYYRSLQVTAKLAVMETMQAEQQVEENIKPISEQVKKVEPIVEPETVETEIKNDHETKPIRQRRLAGEILRPLPQRPTNGPGEADHKPDQGQPAGAQLRPVPQRAKQAEPAKPLLREPPTRPTPPQEQRPKPTVEQQPREKQQASEIPPLKPAHDERSNEQDPPGLGMCK